MSVKEIGKHNKRQFVHNTQMHTNKCIKHYPSKPITTSIRAKGKYANAQYTSGCDRFLEKARTRTFYFENVLQTEGVRI